MDSSSMLGFIRTAVVGVTAMFSDMAAIAQTTTSIVSIPAIAVVGEKLPAIGFVNNVGTSCGQVTITDNRSGQDFVAGSLRCLKPRTKFSLLVTQSPTADALPAQFISEFASDASGNATFTLIAEVVDAYGSANQFLADGQGIANIVGAGLTANGAGTVALDWFRIYESMAADTVVQAGGSSVFGHRASVAGGPLALTSTTPIPNPPLVARLDGDKYVAQFETTALADQNLGSTSPFASAFALRQSLSAHSSTGDIAKFVLEQLGGLPLAVTQFAHGHFGYIIPVDRSYAGTTLTWRLTAFGRNGSKSTSTLTQTIVRSLPEGPLQAQLPSVHLTEEFGTLSCRCTGNIVNYRWEVFSPGFGIGDLAPTKLYLGQSFNSRYISLTFTRGDTLNVRVTVTDASGATSSDSAYVIAIPGANLQSEFLTRDVLPQ